MGNVISPFFFAFERWSKRPMHWRLAELEQLRVESISECSRRFSSTLSNSHCVYICKHVVRLHLCTQRTRHDTISSSHLGHVLTIANVIYVLRNLGICAISRLRCAFSESRNCVPILRLRTGFTQSRDCAAPVCNLEIARHQCAILRFSVACTIEPFEFPLYIKVRDVRNKLLQLRRHLQCRACILKPPYQGLLGSSPTRRNSLPSQSGCGSREIPDLWSAPVQGITNSLLLVSSDALTPLAHYIRKLRSRNIKIAQTYRAISRLCKHTAQSHDWVRNLKIGAQFPDSKNAQRNLEIAQIPKLSGTYTYHEQKTSALQLWSLRNVGRIQCHVLYVVKRKPYLHDGRVMIDLNKNRLVEIPPSSVKQPDDGLTEIQ